MDITAAERVLLHLHAFLNARDPPRETTQVGIAEGARVLRSHVPRAMRALEAQGLVNVEAAHVRGRSRKSRVYRLTESGVRRARELLTSVDATPVDVDGQCTTLGDARRTLTLSPLAALFAVDADGRLAQTPAASEDVDLLQRESDLAFLKRWLAGPARIAVVYGSHGMGKTSLARAFVRSTPRHAWLDVDSCPDVAALAAALSRATGVRAARRDDPGSVGEAILEAARSGWRPVVLDGYGDVAEALVEAFAALVRGASSEVDAKILVLAQESTPAYCRFYERAEVERRVVVDRHLRGLDLEGCRAMLGNPSIDEEALRRIYLLTKGCPLYLRCIRDGDADGLQAASRFTKAEVRLLLYSGGVPAPPPSAS